MNERIQELAVKAKFMAEEDTNRQISYNAELKAFAEKFAELIVKECTNILDEDSFMIPELGGYAYDIRKHFGVE